MNMIKEAIVLNNESKQINGKPSNIIQCVNTTNFILLEVVSDIPKQPQEIIDTEGLIARRISYNMLSEKAKPELEKAIEFIVRNKPDRFINFFNTAKPLGARRHQLDLLPMIGKKHRDAILEYIKKNGKIKSFEDLEKIEMLPDPVKVICTRILDEIKQDPDIKYNFFVLPFYNKKPIFYKK
ncbi:MAG TPA: DUF655 domain-containing protein [archaeon]|nr:DUF655 domain-containing protein [archaeon]